MKKQNGFTLIELMIVIAIVVILASVVKDMVASKRQDVAQPQPVVAPAYGETR